LPVEPVDAERGAKIVRAPSAAAHDCQIMTLTVPLVIGFSFTLLILSYYLQREVRKRQQDIVQNSLATSEELVCCEAERFRIALKNSPIIVFNQDSELRYTWVYNPTPGLDAKEIVGKLDADLVSEEDAQRLTAIKQQVLATGIGTREETYLTSKGEVRYYDLTVEPLRNLNGEIIGITCATIDITECKQTEAALQRANQRLESQIAERTAHLSQVNDELVAEIVEHRQVEIALRKSEQQYRTLIETIPHGIVEIDTTGIITFSNWAYQGLLGYTDGDLLGKSISDLTVKSERSKVLDYIARKVQEQPSPTPYIGQFLTKGGKLIDVQADWSYKRDEQGQVIGFISVVTDITERQQMEQALRTSEERFRIALNNSPTIVFHQDTQFRYTWIYNPALGYEVEEVVGKLESEIFSPEDAERLSLIKRRVLTTGVGTREQTFITSNGDVRYYDLTVEPLRNQVGEVVGITCAATDITDIRAREQELRAIFEGTLEAIVILDDQGKNVAVNPAFCKLLGVPSSQLLGRPIGNFIVSNINIVQEWLTLLQQGQATGELCLQHSDGSLREVEYAARANFLPGRHLAVLRDVTQRKQAEQKIYFQARLLDVIQQAVVVTDLAGNIIYWNHYAELLNGWPASEVLGRPMVDVTPAEITKEQAAEIRSRLQRGESWSGELLVRRRNGTTFPALVIDSPIYDEQGELIGIIGVSVDITQRKQLEAELTASEERFRTSIETMLDCFGMYSAIRDESGQIVDFLIGYVNEAACVNNRMTKEEQIGQRLCELFPAYCEIGLFDEYVKLVETGQPLVKESIYYEHTYQGQSLSRAFDIRAVKLGDGFAAAWRDITERKQAEDALRVSEQRLRTALEAAHMGTWDWNILTGQITWSDNFKRFLGITSDRLDGNYQSFIDIIHPEDRDRVLQKLEKILQEGKDYKDEFRIVLPDGNVRWLASQGQVVYNETGKPVRITGIALDITQRKQAEEEQRKTEQLYRTLASNFPNGVVALFDKDLRYTLTEGKGLAEVGLSKEFLEGKTIAEIFPPEVCEIKERAYRTALNGIPNVCEIPFGDLHYLMYTLPLRNEQGGIYAGMSMSQDISDRKRAELALLEERNFVSAILDTAGALITVCDRQGRFIRVNRACEQITGYSFEEVKDKYVWDLFLIPEEIESVKAVFQELQTGQFPIEHENYWVIRDGNRRLISWSNTAILDAEGSVKYIISIGIDITDRKRAEEIRRALERAQELSDLRLRFFSMVSHEFRTPLSTILVSAQTLEARAHEWPEDKRRKSLRRIESAAKHLTQLLDDVLTINRAETGKLDLNPKALDLEKFCCSLLEELQLQSGNKHTINLVNQGNCKNVFLDERVLRSILSNLLANAIKYSPQGGEIQWLVNCESGKVIFNIRDQGIGIPLPDQIRIFEPFHRGNNVGNIPGTGLGITVVKKCLDLHGGDISINSEEGRGTTVIVTIPERF
jgi:PAS domain S-box-containing protein